MAFGEFASSTGIAALPAAPTPNPPQPTLIDLYDVDAMAARMPRDKDYYQKLRDDLLALYSSRHPAPAPYDDQAREVLRLAAYDMTWGDFYREGVMHDLTRFALAAAHGGCTDPMLADLYFVGRLSVHNPDTDERAVDIANALMSDAGRQSPSALRLWEIESAVHAILGANLNAKTQNLQSPGMQLLPKLISLWEQALAEMIKDKASNSVIYYHVTTLFDGCQNSESTLDLASAAVDQAYNETGAASGLRLALDGDYYITSAWAARGGGYANTVSDQQAQLFAQYLEQARQILEPAYAKYPDEPAISNLMITVAIGASLDRDTMEMWFQRAIKADPNDYAAYLNKAYYLQPRWYGTVDDEWKFSQECAATQNWPHKIPLVLTTALDEVADNGDADIFTRDDVWKLTESVFRKYLELHPRSNLNRTYFLQDAYLGHHQDVVAEQYKILGKNWDRNVIPSDQYKAITASLGP
jgi:hypothetical protein